MSFEPSKIDEFLNNFEANKNAIRDFEGCELLELYNDQNQRAVYFTYSYWQTAEHLENYRQSELFKNVWSKTKPLFNKKPEAWSVNKVFSR